MTEQVRLEADTIGGEVRVKAKTTGGPGRVRLPLAGPRNGQPNRLALPAGLLALFTLVPVLHPPVDAQLPVATDDRYAGLQWRFVRIRYHYTTEGTRLPQDFAGEPWYIDAPAAEQNLSRRVKTATAIQVEDPIVLSLDDPRLFQYPWIYFVEAGNLKMHDGDVTILREFLLRGGTAYFDDFHGPYEWDNFAREMTRVFPDREIIEVPKEHPVFSSFYKIDGYPQVAGLGSFIAGRSWEKGGVVPHLRTILDDTGRPMMFINWNSDMGDGWEWSNAEDYPGYIKYTAMAYRMGINEIVYALTH
ncbi:MAG: hypothetical protein A3J29_21470 [Acidobacteria bacterium RIFCSPLOWO2_12_FULL_67_14b]|nr:MAG: hypothetical protein A3J29_21470 [Acidobacteria bacterium RIFCSPLOWO2_12_FULL_67_14b]